MSGDPSITDPTTWALDREIVLVRVLAAPPLAVFDAWTDAEAFCQWFGPDGFRCTVHEMDVRPGGRVRFDRHRGVGVLRELRRRLEQGPDVLFGQRAGGRGDDRSLGGLRQAARTAAQRSSGHGIGRGGGIRGGDDLRGGRHRLHRIGGHRSLECCNAEPVGTTRGRGFNLRTYR